IPIQKSNSIIIQAKIAMKARMRTEIQMNMGMAITTMFLIEPLGPLTVGLGLDGKHVKHPRTILAHHIVICAETVTTLGILWS
ncbi:MAG: hypothetical protein N0C90_15265, partial [Candidatus Thiodiazotropha endolucinida]|nr:hypothetical protein [Candidatus Thiodiazotropha taylori]MCW4262720.1 hypothetical protein [Candidatus Thiodiazotropha endolucinida]